jgi:hypothetical protein
MPREVSLREQLGSFLPPEKVQPLLDQYHELTEANPHWTIGGFIAMIKAVKK